MQTNPLELTKAVLKDCFDVGYEIVSIRTPTSLWKHYIGGKCSLEHISIFGKFNDKLEKTRSFPPIWDIAQKYEIGHGCGNSHQYQLNPVVDLINGVYIKEGWEEQLATNVLEQSL